jgi:hypothetical protein
MAACGPKLPPRYVVESDQGDYKFRRYQQVLDVELAIDGNDAVGHTATYVRGGKTIQVVPVFLTVYQRARGLTESVRQRLRGMSGYNFEVAKLEGEYVYRMQGESGDNWVLWVSGPHLVKLGAPEGSTEVPGELLGLYLDKYPSDLDDKGKADDGAASAGPAASESAEAAAPDAGPAP